MLFNLLQKHLSFELDLQNHSEDRKNTFFCLLFSLQPSMQVALTTICAAYKQTS